MIQILNTRSTYDFTPPSSISEVKLNFVFNNAIYNLYISINLSLNSMGMIKNKYCEQINDKLDS